MVGGPACGGGAVAAVRRLLGFNGCNCGRSIGYYPSPLYVVNQGPEYSGPGLMLPYGTYAPGAAYAPGINYPYVGPRYGYRGPGFTGIGPIVVRGSLIARTLMSTRATTARGRVYTADILRVGNGLEKARFARAFVFRGDFRATPN